MQLGPYLKRECIPYRAFAKRIGVANASVVARYVAGRVPRDAATIEAIERETGGEVMLSDLYAKKLAA